MSLPIIIDTDPGIDDAMAIYLALLSPELELVGLTTVFGNAPVEICTRNALRILEIADRTDVPVAQGSRYPLTNRPAIEAPHVHGSDGQGNTDLYSPSQRALDISAPEFIVEHARQQPGLLTVVMLGPLTNLALALRLEPALPALLKQVIIMGGNAFCQGNVNPAAEANIFGDPEAADLVFATDWDLTMVGLDVTNSTLMTAQTLKTLFQKETPILNHLKKITPFYNQFIKRFFGVDGIYLHDSIAIAYLLVPEYFKTQRYPVAVETQGLGMGKTWVCTTDIANFTSRHEAWRGRMPARICLELDGEALQAFMIERFTA
ncbi:nucleoside hydrolase [Anaerolineales bacterium]